MFRTRLAANSEASAFYFMKEPYSTTTIYSSLSIRDSAHDGHQLSVSKYTPPIPFLVEAFFLLARYLDAKSRKITHTLHPFLPSNRTEHRKGQPSCDLDKDNDKQGFLYLLILVCYPTSIFPARIRNTR